MRMLFSFFEADKQFVVAEPVVYIQYIIGNQYSSISYSDIPPMKEAWFSNLVYQKFNKSREAYFKKHSKAFNTYKRKGYRHRR